MAYTRKIRDPIYGFIEIDTEIEDILDNEFVQRLRWVNQLPLEQLVYPSANNSRFEHSIGVMNLAGIASKALTYNSEELLLKAINSSSFPVTKDKQDKFKNFILLSKICGLLHDIGHAPFSHTFEFAIGMISNEELSYNHEEFGFKIIKKIISKYFDNNKSNIVLNVLNKKIKIEELEPVEKILRNIIDFDFDVDKGDYLLRDSYHCGVNYGFYDYKRLWENICLIKGDGFNGIYPNEKAATEVWRLLLARYFMHKNVYEHKFRLRTDAMLMYIIIRTATHNFDFFQKNFPFTNPNILVVNDIIALSFLECYDQNFISNLRKIKSDGIDASIEEFFKRKIFKEIFRAEGKNREIIRTIKKDEIKEVTRRLWENSKEIFPNDRIAFSINKSLKPPLANKSLNEKIRVSEFKDINKSKYKDINFEDFKTLSEFLSFEIIKNEYSQETYELYAFSDNESIKIKLENYIQETLEDFNSKKSNISKIQ